VGCTQREWPGETVPDYGCSSAAVARVDAAFVGRVQGGPSSSASEGATRTGLPLRTYWASAYGHWRAIRHQGAIRHGPASPWRASTRLDHLLVA
jgi:hypothetical protein